MPNSTISDGTMTIPPPIKEEERALGGKIRKIKKEIEYKNLDKETLLKK